MQGSSAEATASDSVAWGFIDACEVAKMLLSSFVYSPGLPGVDRSGPVTERSFLTGAVVAANRRFSGAGGVQNVLLALGPPALWKALEGVEVSIRRQDEPDQVVAKARVTSDEFISFDNVSYRYAYIFRLEGIL